MRRENDSKKASKRDKERKSEKERERIEVRKEQNLNFIFYTTMNNFIIIKRSIL